MRHQIMTEPLDPARLTPTASLNRLRLVDLPGLQLEPDVKGRLFYELLSADAAADLIRQAQVPGLAGAEASTLLPAFDRAFASRDERLSAVAEEVARRLGRRLAYLVLTLRRGDVVNRAAREDWDESYWEHWAGIRSIWLGGGVMSGNLGARMVAHAARLLDEVGQVDCRLHRAVHAALLPIIGAARGVPPGHEAAVVFDFGGTSIKPALALYKDSTLVSVGLMTPVPSALDELRELEPGERVERLGRKMVDVMAAAWQELSGLDIALAPRLGAAIASYIRHNQPLPRQGGTYAELLALSDSLGDWLARRLERQLGQAVEVALIHDGTAAARVYAGQPAGAVIMLGTALGVGFPGTATGLLPVAEVLQVV